MKKETKKLIAAGIVMALGCGVWGSVSAADIAYKLDQVPADIYVNREPVIPKGSDTSVTMSKGGAATTFKTDLGGGWWEFGVGTNLDLGHDTHFYLDVETTAGGDVDTPWQWNAGVRYSF